MTWTHLLLPVVVVMVCGGVLVTLHECKYSLPSVMGFININLESYNPSPK